VSHLLSRQQHSVCHAWNSHVPDLGQHYVAVWVAIGKYCWFTRNNIQRTKQERKTGKTSKTMASYAVPDWCLVHYKESNSHVKDSVRTWLFRGATMNCANTYSKQNQRTVVPRTGSMPRYWCHHVGEWMSIHSEKISKKAPKGGFRSHAI